MVEDGVKSGMQLVVSEADTTKMADGMLPG